MGLSCCSPVRRVTKRYLNISSCGSATGRHCYRAIEVCRTRRNLTIPKKRRQRTLTISPHTPRLTRRLSARNAIALAIRLGSVVVPIETSLIDCVNSPASLTTYLQVPIARSDRGTNRRREQHRHTLGLSPTRQVRSAPATLK